MTETVPWQTGANAGLDRARALKASGEYDGAHAAYLDILNREPDHVVALHELGDLAHANGFRTAARTIFERLVHINPKDKIARVNLGTILHEEGSLSLATGHFAIALDIDPDFADAHRGLGRIFQDTGDSEIADRHWRRSFPRQGVVVQPYRGLGRGIAMLLLVSVKGGNIPTRSIIDDRVYAVTTLYAEYYNSDFPLPGHAILFNAIGDADLCAEALAAATKIVRMTDAPVINKPSHVERTGRGENAGRLGSLESVKAPHIETLSRDGLAEAHSLKFPLLLRAAGYHTGQFFEFVHDQGSLEAAAKAMPGDKFLAIEYLDARGADGLARKYRVMCIGGALFPIHLAISGDWKVHYFTADMTASEAHRGEEKRFLEDMTAVLGAPAMVALARIAETLGLEYAGIDFALHADGSVLLFEANATMVIHPPGPETRWDYRREPINRALAAARQLPGLLLSQPGVAPA